MKQGLISEIHNPIEPRAEAVNEEVDIKKEPYKEKPIVELLGEEIVLEQDIYLKLRTSKYIKVCREGMILETQRLQTYIRKGVGSYYVLKDLP